MGRQSAARRRGRVAGRRTRKRPLHLAKRPPNRLFALFGARLGMSSAAAKSAVLTMTDQGFASVSNFAVGVVVARLTGAAGLGAFALAYTAWILLINLHRGLITDPMAIFGDARDDDTEKVRQGFAAEVLLGVAAAGAVAVVGLVLVWNGWRTFGVGMLALAPWVPALNLQDYWRWIGFMQRRPDMSLANDAIFDVGQAAGFIVLFATGTHSVFAVISAWGFGATVGTVWGLRQFRIWPSLQGGFEMLRSRWHMSKWLVSSSVTSWGASSLAVVVIGGVLGPVALGGLKAAQALAWGPLAVIMQAGTSFGLPEASRALASHGWKGLRKVGLLISGSTFIIAATSGVVLLVAGHTLLDVVYGRAFGRFDTAAVLSAVSYMIGALALGPGLLLKAVKRTRALFATQTVAVVIAVAGAVVLSLGFGVDGAAASAGVSGLWSLVAMLVFLSRSHPNAAAVRMEAPSQGIDDLGVGQPEPTTATSELSSTQ